MKSRDRVVRALLLALALGGCARMAGVVGTQQGSENYARLPGAEASHPAFIDGDLKTAGETTFPLSEGSTGFVLTPPSEAQVLLPEPRTITKVVIHSDELKGFDLFAEDPVQGWKFMGKYDGQKGPVITIPLKGIVRTTGIKIRVRRSARDVETRRRNIRRGIGISTITGETRAPAQIYEIELLGPAESPTPSTSPASPASEKDELSGILMEGLTK